MSVCLELEAGALDRRALAFVAEESQVVTPTAGGTLPPPSHVTNTTSANSSAPLAHDDRPRCVLSSTGHRIASPPSAVGAITKRRARW
jgi:hypothetical protein